MKAEHVNAFLVPMVQVLQKMARINTRVGKVARLDDSRVQDNLSIIVGLNGTLSGSVVFTASREVAWALAGRIVSEDLRAEQEGDVRAILAEVANTIVGNATGQLYALGVREGITPPTVILGPSVQFDFGPASERVRIPVETDVGWVEMIVSFNKDTP